MNNYRSKDEEIFATWCKEALAKGHIEAWEYEPETIEIFPKATITVTKQLKTKIKYEDKTILQPLSYTPDFIIEAMLDVFMPSLLNTSMENSSHYNYFAERQTYMIDIKPSGYTKFNDSKSFSIVQKALWHSQGIYVNKVRLDKFLAAAWVPEPVLDKGDLVWCNKDKHGNRRLRSDFSGLKTYKQSEWPFHKFASDL